MTTQQLTARPGWVARRADGTLDLNGYRLCRVDADGTYCYTGPAFSADDVDLSQFAEV